jgi:hypothetical protein
MCLLIFAGCYGPVDITYHEAGHYKGPEDQLLARERSPEQQKQLLERFQLGQTDR